MTRIVVVGAGAVGLCDAIALAERGATVTLLERGLPGAANSTVTGGGIRQQFGTESNVALSLLSAPYWQSFAARFGVDPWFREIGYLFVGHDEKQATVLRTNVALQNRLGVTSEFIDREEMKRRWPWLARRGACAGAFRREDGWANQHRIIDGLTRGALARGVDVQVGVEVLCLQTRAGNVVGVVTTAGNVEADKVVLASGPWMALLAELGLALPVTGRRHELLIVEPADPLPVGTPWLIGVRDEVHMRPDTPGRALVGGFLGQDIEDSADEFDGRAGHAWAHRALEKVGEVFGVVDRRARIRRGWAGLYPATPDRHPIIDCLLEGLYVTLGFSGTGLMHAPAAGRLLTELIFDGAIASTRPGPFSASRFAKIPSRTEPTGF